MVETEEVSHTQHIVYVLFVIVLSITGIYIAFSFLGGASIAFTFHDYASRLNIIASRLLLAPECFALVEEYSKDGTHRQVRAGIIDFSRVPSDNIIPEKCVRGENASWVQLKDLDETDASKQITKLWSCTEIGCYGQSANPAAPCGFHVTQQVCERHAGCSWGIVPCPEPSLDGWSKEERTFFVLVKKGGEFHKGVLTVRLKG
jgi:hypothetical protein